LWRGHWKPEGCGHHADDGERIVAEADRSTDDGFVSAKLGKPKSVADQDNPASRVFFFGQEASPEFG
jgi:hypothetical protein